MFQRKSRGFKRMMCKDRNEPTSLYFQGLKHRTTDIGVESRKVALRVSSQTRWAIRKEPVGTISRSWKWALCHGYSRPEESSHALRSLCVVEKWRSPKWQKETTHVEVAWRSARASGPTDLLVTSSHGRPVTQAKYVCKGLQDGRQE